jgi:hypothetical protein
VSTELTSDKGLHLSIKAFADNPTLKLIIDATLQNPVFDFYIHRISWTVSSAFHAHVSYAFELVHSLDGTVSEVNGMITKAIQQQGPDRFPAGPDFQAQWGNGRRSNKYHHDDICDYHLLYASMRQRSVLLHHGL